MALTKNMLLDSWEVNGSTFDELYSITDDLDKKTKFIEMDTSNIKLFSFMERTDTGIKGSVAHKWIPEEKEFTFEELVTKHGADDALISELEHNKLAFVFNDYLFYASSNILATLSQRADARLGKIFLVPDVEVRTLRDLIFTAYMYLYSSRCHVIYREAEGAKKIIGVLSDRHLPISQTDSIKGAIKILEEDLGAADLKWFKVNASDTLLYVEFPEKKDDYRNVKADDGTLVGTIPDEVVPGAVVRTADGGESSFTVIGTIRIGKNVIYIPTAKTQRAHTKNATISGIKTSVKQTVHSEFATIPNRLIELLTIDVTPTKELLEKIANDKNIEMYKVIGKGAQNEVIENIYADINPALPYTAYDIAMAFLDEGTRLEEVNSRDEVINKIRACFVKTVFFKYEEL